MKAYKFRPARPLKYTEDIIRNHRMYCSDWKKLNDPMEGTFSTPMRLDINGFEEKINAVMNKTKTYKICSLSSDLHNPLLWGYYANGFNGFAIEIEIELEDNKVEKVYYRDDVYKEISSKFLSSVKEDEIAKRILFSKRIEWEGEKEIRVLSNSEMYDVSVTRVIGGNRLGDNASKKIRSLCDKEKIVFCKVTEINPLGKILYS